MNTSQPARTLRRLVMAVFLAAFAAASGVAAPWGDTVKGSGAVRKQDRPATGITAVELSIPAEVEVRIGANEGVTIETHENLLPLIESSVENGVLELKPVRKNLKLSTNHLRIVVTAREIRNLSIGGGGTIRAGMLRSPRLELEIGGAGRIDIQQLEADSVDAEIGGSGNIALAGYARKLSIEIAGSGDVQATKLRAEEAVVSIAGSGSATLWPTNGLKVAIAGSGDVRYFGDPKTQTSVAGSGGIQRLGAAPR